MINRNWCVLVCCILVGHDKHLTHDCIIAWSRHPLNYVLTIIVILVTCSLILYYTTLSSYYIFIYVISYPVFPYNSNIICSHEVYTCTFSHFTHSLRVFWLLWICTYRSMYILFCWSSIWRVSHVLLGARTYSFDLLILGIIFALFFISRFIYSILCIVWTLLYFIWLFI